MKLGLDELIIVNPGAPPPATSWFLGSDGGIYRLNHASRPRGTEVTSHEPALGDPEPVPRFFLGENGILYETR